MKPRYLLDSQRSTTKSFRSFVTQSGWIVPVGELEGFCKSVGGHGPRWVQNVIETKELAKGPELSRAREFVMDIWNRKTIVAADDGDPEALIEGEVNLPNPIHPADS